jgi:type II restriction/modification system DNA methylase subunit YeeA
MVIDLFGLAAEEVRQKFPAVYQHVLTRVKPERDANNRATYRENWWMFGEPRKDFRPALVGVRRYVATTETSKHRFFQFLDASILPDNMLIAIALDDAFHLGVLGSRVHVVYSLAAGGRLGVGNDPRYNKSRCFDPFPFPACGDATRERIRNIAEELDGHRKRVQAQNPGLTLTGMYNVLEKLRVGVALNEQEKRIHDAGLVSVLRQLHDDLDAAVFAAYGWPTSLTDAEILERLVALNAERAKEEASRLVRWLRPEYQNPGGAQGRQAALAVEEAEGVKGVTGA